MVILKSNITDLMRQIDELDIKLTDKFLINLGFRIERAVKEEITEKGLVDTGRWRTSVHSRKIGESTILIADAVTYGEYHERGTGIYGPFKQVIRPKKARVLSFKVKRVHVTRTGRRQVKKTQVFAKSVKGVKKSAPFFSALERIESEISNELAALD